MLSNEQLAHLKALYDASTQGEWHGIYGDDDGMIHPTTEYEDGLYSSKDEEYITTLHNSFPAIYKELVEARELEKAIRKQLNIKENELLHARAGQLIITSASATPECKIGVGPSPNTKKYEDIKTVG